jgi:toxin-antitoxin system PIN domain toxin
MIFLLDVNLLFVLHQPRHFSYEPVSRWFTRKSAIPFATCPMTQAGMLRLLMQEIAGSTRFSIDEAHAALENLVEHSRHVYWPDDPPYLQATTTLSKRMQGHRQITDAYLLGLAKHHGGKLATLDKAIVSLAGPEFADLVELIA